MSGTKGVEGANAEESKRKNYDGKQRLRYWTQECKAPSPNAHLSNPQMGIIHTHKKES